MSLFLTDLVKQNGALDGTLENNTPHIYWRPGMDKVQIDGDLTASEVYEIYLWMTTHERTPVPKID